MGVSSPDPGLDEAIRRTQGGDVEAFATVVLAFQRPLRTWLSRDCVPGIDPGDVAHRAFITAFTQIHDFTPGTNCFAWLCTIARNHLRDELKRLHRHRAVPIDALHGLAGLELDHASDGGEPGDERRLAALRACLGKLPALMMELVEMRYTRQAPLGEIAIALGTSLGAVKVRLHHLRGKLHDCMQARLGGLEP
jgi:RNA polymerase sigma-70 factor (ECF subfamily)